MSFDPFDSGFFNTIFTIAFVLPVVITFVVVGVVVWAIWRASAGREDPAIAELKGRYARGEIDTAEYQARLDALTRER